MEDVCGAGEMTPGNVELTGAEGTEVAEAADRRSAPGKVLIVPMPDDSEAEVTLPGSYSIAAGLRDTIGGLPGIAQVEEI